MRRAGIGGSALVAVLWCLVVLEVVVIGMLRAGRLELRVVKNHGDLIQAHYLALAGIEKAKALIYRETRDLEAAGKSHGSTLWENPEAFKDAPLGRGMFRVIRGARKDEGGARLIYGLRDEESRLNVNHASAEELKKLPGMTDGAAAAILDWRDGDSRVTPGGAEGEDYAALSPPYRPRNGPLWTLRELLMVRGVDPQLLLGEDRNANGLLDPEENDGALTEPPDNSDGLLDASWSALLTVESSVENRSARGKRRVDIKTAGEDSLATVEGISGDLAKAIVAYRNEKPFESIADLLEVTPVKKNDQAPVEAGGQPPPASGPAPGQLESVSRARAVPPPPPAAPAEAQPAQPGAPAGTGGEKLVSEALFKQIADEISVEPRLEQEGLVNINTARSEVLSCLPGISLDLAEAIVAHRRGNGPFDSIAQLLDVPGMTRESFKQVSARVTARAGTYRILSEGLLPGTGARKRIEVVVRMGDYQMETLSYREDL